MNHADIEEKKKKYKINKLRNEIEPRLTQAMFTFLVRYQNHSDGFLCFLANHRALKW